MLIDSLLSIAPTGIEIRDNWHLVSDEMWLSIAPTCIEIGKISIGRYSCPTLNRTYWY